MNEITSKSANLEEYAILSERLKKQRALVDEKTRELNAKIEKDCEEARNKRKRGYQEAFDSEPAEVQEKLKKRQELQSKIDGSAFLTFALGVVLLIALILVKSFVMDFEIVNGFLTYCIIIVGAFLVAGIPVSMRNNGLRKAIESIGKDERIAEFDKKENAENANTENFIGFIKELKYNAEMDEIERLQKEQNALEIEYNKARAGAICQKYGDAIIFYFKKIPFRCGYEIKINGSRVCFSESEKLQRIRLNPGYQSIELVLIYVDVEGMRKTSTYAFQKSADECPCFIVCNKVSHYDSEAKCREVGVEEFETFSGLKLL